MREVGGEKTEKKSLSTSDEWQASRPASLRRDVGSSGDAEFRPQPETDFRRDRRRENPTYLPLPWPLHAASIPDIGRTDSSNS